MCSLVGQPGTERAMGQSPQEAAFSETLGSAPGWQVADVNGAGGAREPSGVSAGSAQRCRVAGSGPVTLGCSSVSQDAWMLSLGLMGYITEWLCVILLLSVFSHLSAGLRFPGVFLWGEAEGDRHSEVTRQRTIPATLFTFGRETGLRRSPGCLRCTWPLVTPCRLPVTVSRSV